MKKYFLIFLIPLFFACGHEAEKEKLQSKIDSLQKISNQDAGSINEFLKSLNEIESNLEEIKTKENIISVKTRGDVELDQSAKDKITEDISSIYELMIKNKKKLAYLNRKLIKANAKSGELQKMIERMTRQLDEKDAQITSLKNNLSKLNLDIDNLNTEIKNLESDIDTLQDDNTKKEELIDKQTEELNTAYYVYGTKRELKKQNVITSEGGFIGIGRMQKLVENFSKDYFKKVDIRKLSSIPLFSKKAKIVTTHPAGSFYFAGEGKIDSLVIKDNKQFWSVSKYLVVIIN